MTEPRAIPEDAAFAFGTDLHVDLHGPKLRAGLTDALRDAVRSGRLAPGTRLPSSRTLAADLGIGRNTVADAYTELVAEGWLTAQQGSGTRVAERTQVPEAEPSARPRAVTPPRPRYAMLPGSPDLAAFPRARWLAAARRALAAAPNDAFGYGDPLGRIELRSALADYLARARGVYAAPERIAICSGFHHGLTLIARVLKARGVTAVAVESYGLDIYRDLLVQGGLDVPPLAVDQDGVRPDGLAALPSAGAALLTPAHQYPTGVALTPDRRLATLDWARATGGLILEDDYDGEFRYDRTPVGAVQGLDRERVVYFGSASKPLAPGVRLGWMVLPGELVAAVVREKGHGDYMSSALEQLTMAEFITSGAYDRHIRAMRGRYRRRREQLVTALARRAPQVHLAGTAAGLQAVLQLPPGTEQSVVRAAARQGLAISGLAEFRHPDADPELYPPHADGVVVNYAAPSDSAWTGALDTLCAVMP